MLLTKKSHKIHFIKESIEIYVFLNTNGHFISNEKSQLNTNGFRCIVKRILIVLIEYHKIYLYFRKVLIEYFLWLKSLLKSFEILI